MGFIIIGIGSVSIIGLTAGIFHMLNHAMFKALLFLCAGTIIYKTGTKDIREHQIGWTMPVTLITYIIGILAVIGITPLNGSVSKSLIETAMNEYPIIAIMLIIASIGTVASFTKIFYYSFLKSFKKQEKTKYDDAPASMLVPMIILAGLCIILGIIPQFWLETLILPASSVAITNNPIQLSFIEPISILKEWGIVAGGLFFLLLILKMKTVVEVIRNKISMIPMNQSIILMILTLIIVSILLGLVP